MTNAYIRNVDVYSTAYKTQRGKMVAIYIKDLQYTEYISEDSNPIQSLTESIKQLVDAANKLNPRIKPWTVRVSDYDASRGFSIINIGPEKMELGLQTKAIAKINVSLILKKESKSSLDLKTKMMRRQWLEAEEGGEA